MQAPEHDTSSDISFADSIRSFDIKYGRRFTHAIDEQQSIRKLKAENKSMKKTIKHLLQEISQHRAMIRELQSAVSQSKNAIDTNKLEFVWNIPDFDFSREDVYDSAVFCFGNIAWRLSLGRSSGGSHYGLILGIAQQVDTVSGNAPQIIMCHLLMHHEFRFPYQRDPILLDVSDKSSLRFCGYHKFIPIELFEEYIMDDGSVVCSVVLHTIEKCDTLALTYDDVAV